MTTGAGQLRRVHTPWGRADVGLEAGGLRVRSRGGLDAEQVVALLLAAALVLGLGGASLPDPLGWLLWGPALVALLAAVVLLLVVWGAGLVALAVAGGSLLTRGGRRRLADDVGGIRERWRHARDGTLLPVADLVAPPVVERGRLRARLVLPTRAGPVALTTWAWRADRLVDLAHRLDLLARTGPR